MTVLSRMYRSTLLEDVLWAVKGNSREALVRPDRFAQFDLPIVVGGVTDMSTNADTLRVCPGTIY